MLSLSSKVLCVIPVVFHVETNVFVVVIWRCQDVSFWQCHGLDVSFKLQLFLAD